MPAALDGGLHFAGSRLDVATANIGVLALAGATPLPSGGLAIGTGDNIPYLSETNIPSLLDVRVGTSARPDTSANAPVKVSRTFAGTAASGSFSGQPVGQVAALTGAVSVVNPGDVQGFGVFGLGHTSSTAVAGANGKADATGVAGVAIAEDPTIHLASGGFFSGIMVTTAGAAEGVTGVQIAAQNKTGLGDHTVNLTGFSKSVAVYITAGNAFDLNGAAIEICNTGIVGHGANAGRFDVGLHVPGQVSNGLTGAIATAVVQDDGQSLYSYLVNGTHASAAFAVASGSGSLILGETSLQVSTALLEVMSAGAADPVVEVRTNSAVAISNRVVRGPAGSVKFGYCGAGGNFLTSTIAGDTVLVPTTSLHLGGTVRCLSVTAGNVLTSQIDHTFAAHIVSTASGAPTTTNLGANVSSVTFTGNDVRGTIAVVMSGALAANTRISTNTFAISYGATSPKVTLVDQTSAVGLTIVNFYVSAQATGVSFDLSCDQALAAGTYTIDYIVIG